MKCLRRNKRPFEYLPYSGTETDLNKDGEHTGEFRREYGRPVEMRGNISMPSGRVNQTFYGDDIRYTHTLVMDDPGTIINEYGLIRFNGELYTVEAVRRSINCVNIALRKQTSEFSDPYVPDEPDALEEPEEPEESGGTEGEEE